MTTTSAQLDAVIAATRHIPEANFTAYRGGYPQEISTALIDAVFSIQAQYDSATPGRGVRNRVQAFRSENPGVINDLSALVDLGAEHVVQIMGKGKTGRRLKAGAVLEAAAGYVAIGVNSADDFRGLEPATAKRVYTDLGTIRIHHSSRADQETHSTVRRAAAQGVEDHRNTTGDHNAGDTGAARLRLRRSAPRQQRQHTVVQQYGDRIPVYTSPLLPRLGETRRPVWWMSVTAR